MVAFAAAFFGSLTLVRLYGPGAAIIFGVPSAMAFATATLSARFAAGRMTAWPAVFVFPAVLTSYEFLASQISLRDARLHSRMAVTRGIENGFTIARSAQEGLVTFSDSYGRILGEQSSATDPMMVQAIPAGSGPTPYTRYGDWFGWAAVVMSCGLFARVIGFGSRPTTAGVSPVMHQ